MCVSDESLGHQHMGAVYNRGRIQNVSTIRGQGRYRGGETSVESAIPCSHKGKTLVVKRAEEVENAKAFSKYQDKVEGQRSENFIRLVSTGFSSR
ncbi:hypothetical protein BHM03_00029265 [Ensete ventricosum]|nr:hypothetical protein BHM03_00029265 [Ensete ventricosum]